jgi:hypothetical protein
MFIARNHKAWYLDTEEERGASDSESRLKKTLLSVWQNSTSILLFILRIYVGRKVKFNLGDNNHCLNNATYFIKSFPFNYKHSRISNGFFQSWRSCRKQQHKAVKVHAIRSVCLEVFLNLSLRVSAAKQHDSYVYSQNTGQQKFSAVSRKTRIVMKYQQRFLTFKDAP